jgi:hypothetical protein
MSLGSAQAVSIPWYQRRSSSWGYTVHLVFWFTLLFWSLMLIPYVYDQLNKHVYQQAVVEGTLVVREFSTNTPPQAEIDRCRPRPRGQI